MLKRLITTSTALVLLAACGESPVEAPLERQPEMGLAAQQYKSEFSTVVDFCGAEPVAVEGFFHDVSNFTITPSGRVNVVGQLNAKGQGTGLVTGAKYQWNDKIQFNESVDLNDFAPYVFRARSNLRLIGQGGAPNYSSPFSVRVTVDANGVVRVDDFRSEQTCR